MSQYRNGIPIPNSAYEEVRAGQSESLYLDPTDLRTPNRFTSSREKSPAYRAFVERAKQERKHA
jgi:hypothetical protein